MCWIEYDDARSVAEERCCCSDVDLVRTSWQNKGFLVRGVPMETGRGEELGQGIKLNQPRAARLSLRQAPIIAWPS